MKIDRDSEHVELIQDAELVPVGRLEQKARSVGIELESGIKQGTFATADLYCQKCAQWFEADLNRNRAIHNASANYAAQTVSIEYHPEAVSERQLCQLHTVPSR